MTMEAVPVGGRHRNSQSLEMGTVLIWGWACPHFQGFRSHTGALGSPGSPIKPPGVAWHGIRFTHCPPLTAALLLAHDEILAARARHPRGTPGGAGRAPGLAGRAMQGGRESWAQTWGQGGAGAHRLGCVSDVWWGKQPPLVPPPMPPSSLTGTLAAVS